MTATVFVAPPDDDAPIVRAEKLRAPAAAVSAPKPPASAPVSLPRAKGRQTAPVTVAPPVEPPEPIFTPMLLNDLVSGVKGTRVLGADVGAESSDDVRGDAREALGRLLPTLVELSNDSDAPSSERIAAIREIARIAAVDKRPEATGTLAELSLADLLVRLEALDALVRRLEAGQ